MFHSVMFACPQLLNMNPNARNMMESNTQLRDMFQNPEFLRQMTSPEALQVESVAIHVYSCSHSFPMTNYLFPAAITLIPADTIRTAWSTSA